MIRTSDWQYVHLYICFVVRGSYKTVLTRCVAFSDVIEALADHMGRPVPELKPLNILSVLQLGEGDADFIEEHELPSLIL